MLLKLDAHQSAKARAELVEAAETYRRGDRIEIPRTAWIISAAKE
jgi:hypothetical protein